MACIMVISLAACSAGGTKQAAGSSDQAATQIADYSSMDPKDVTGKITIWNYDEEYFQKLFDHFHEKYPNVEVNLVPVDSADYAQKFITAYATGTELPDIAVLEESIFVQLANIDGAFEDLEQAPYNLKREDVQEGYKPLSINNAGKMIAVNEAVTASGFAYKRDVAEKYLGVSEPADVEAKLKTWDDYCELGARMYEESGGQDYLFYCYRELTRLYAAMFDGTFVDNNGVINEENLRKFCEQCVKFRQANLADPKIASLSNPEWKAAMSDSNHLLTYCAPWCIRYNIKPNDENGSGRWGLINAPMPYCWGGTGFAITSKSENKAAAFLFLKEIFMSEEGGKFYKSITEGEIIPYVPYYNNKENVKYEDEYFCGQDTGNKIVEWIDQGAKLKEGSKYDSVRKNAFYVGSDELAANPDITADELYDIIVKEIETNKALVD